MERDHGYTELARGVGQNQTLASPLPERASSRARREAGGSSFMASLGCWPLRFR
jgi:hypothetical protein